MQDIVADFRFKLVRFEFKSTKSFNKNCRSYKTKKKDKNNFR